MLAGSFPAGKLVYSGAERLSGSDYSLVDYNRAGVPLLEIVSGPDMRSGQEAAAYGAEIRRIMRFLDASDGNMAVRKTEMHIMCFSQYKILWQPCTCS